jgi:hypothetical protein
MSGVLSLCRQRTGSPQPRSPKGGPMARGTMHAPKPDGQRRRRNTPTHGERWSSHAMARSVAPSSPSSPEADRLYPETTAWFDTPTAASVGRRVRGDRLARSRHAGADRRGLLAPALRRGAVRDPDEPEAPRREGLMHVEGPRLMRAGDLLTCPAPRTATPPRGRQRTVVATSALSAAEQCVAGVENQLRTSSLR